MKALKRFVKRKIFFRLFNFYPPFFGAGIRVKIAPDIKSVDVSLKLHFWNRNYVNTHYGGSLYSMCDPFFMFLLMENLGSEYIVWDKSATIHFKKPGKGRVRAHFHITEEEYARIRKQAEKQQKLHPAFSVDIVDESSQVVATVEKIIHIRKKSPATTK